MLTRKSENRNSKLNPCKRKESHYVVEKSKDIPTDASLVCSSIISNSRQVGSNTKQVGDVSEKITSCSTTFPKGENTSAKSIPSREINSGSTKVGSEKKSQKVSGNAHVFVLDKNHKPLMPCQPARARELLKKGKAVIVRLYPFIIRLKDRVGGVTQPLKIKLDPGSKTTGVALVREDKNKITNVLWLAELTHRGSLIRDRLTKRALLRHNRKSRHLRYRAAKFINRTKPTGWLAPSLRHRVVTTISWVKRLSKWSPITSSSMELVKFDTQKLLNPEISGVEYQRGELFGYEVREYLLEKFGHRCVYCDVENTPLQIDHVEPKSKGGSNRVSNLVLACKKCNSKKDSKSVDVFLKKDKSRLQKIKSQLKVSLRDAAAVNSTKNIIFKELSNLLPTETSSGAITKWNRSKLGIPKTHALDAVCVGDVNIVRNWKISTLNIKCNGRGSYQRTRTDSYGFPRGYLTREKSVRGFQTGDIVKAVIKSGKRIGTHIGRVAVRASGSFDIKTKFCITQGIGWKNCKVIQRSDGYSYEIIARDGNL